MNHPKKIALSFLPLFKNRKAQLILKPMIELLVGIAILLIFLYVGKSYGSGDVFQKIGFAEDNAATINTITSLSGNTFSFHKDGSKFSSSFQDYFTTVYLMDNDPTIAKRFFSLPSGCSLTSYIDSESVFTISKSGNCIDVSEIKTIPEKIRCPSISFNMPDKITITPLTIDNMTFKFTEALAASINKAETKDPKDISTNTGLLIEIINIPSEKNTSDNLDNLRFKIYINPDMQSRKVACLIANNLIETYPEYNIQIIPSERQSLKRSKIGLALELKEEFQTSNTIKAISKALI